MKKRHVSIIPLAVAMLSFCGCMSPLKSDDAEVRKRAIEKISDNDELFLISMNVGIEVGRTSGSYCNAFYFSETYPDDVRVAAVNRNTDPLCVLKCATWPDGEVYYHEGVQAGELRYKGETYWVHDAESRLQEKVRPGDAVRKAALNKLSTPSEFSKLVSALSSLNAADNDGRGRTNAKTIRGALFPGKESYSVGSTETSFVDYYGGVRKDNPLDRALETIVQAQNDQGQLCAFVAGSAGDGVDIYPRSVACAIKRIDGSDDIGTKEAFVALTSNASNRKCRIPVMWPWQLLNVMKNPSDEVSIAAATIGYGDKQDADTIDKRYIDATAEKRFTANGWVTCYLKDLFKDYPKAKIVKNINSQDAAVRLLIEARRMSKEDVEQAFSVVKDAETVEKIKADCYLKNVADKAEVVLFDKTYAKKLDATSKMMEALPRAIEAHKYNSLLKQSSIPDAKKTKIRALLDKWILAGVAQLEQSSKGSKASSFSINGFRVGMKSEYAKFLYEAKYENEEISWTINDSGVVDRINFGTTYLAKVYHYDAQTWDQWISCFSRSTGRKFVHDVLKDEKKPIGGRGTIVKVSQEIWRCQDNRANITMTYFGEKKVQEIEPEASGFVESVFKIARGITAGDVLKEVVLEGSRHWANKGWESGVGGYPGMLRIETGSVGPGGTKSIRQPQSKSGLDQSLDSVKDTWDAMKDAAPAVEGFLNNVFN